MRLGTIVAGAACAVSLYACGFRSPPPPPQPVPFSHKTHAGANGIGCTACHVFAARGPVAGIPSAQRCYGCHRFVDKQKPNVQKVDKAFLDGAPLEWARVHRVPDHVYFTHERHIAAGLQCAQCHGAVETMDVMHQVSPLTMGWCVDCHRAKGASTDCWTCHK